MHSYTIIGLKTTQQDNGFQYLHSELCGSKYTNAISHAEKISELLDSINTIILSDVTTDSVCCESIDTLSLNTYALTNASGRLLPTFYYYLVSSYIEELSKSIILANYSRGPPIS